MIAYETRLGNISFSEEYLSKIIGNAVSNCYGVVKMVPNNRQKLLKALKPSEYADKGIKVKGNINSISVELHIAVVYGININTIAQSITEAVTYTVKAATDIDVSNVTVRIDEIVTE